LTADPLSAALLCPARRPLLWKPPREDFGMPAVYFVKQQRTVDCPAGTNLRRLALDHGIDLYVFPTNILHCRGNGLCGTCRVKVDNPRALSGRTASDERKCGWEGEPYRLACQSMVLGDIQVVTNPRKIQAWANHPTYQWMRQLE
jgi:ferredoxin